tara:strand:+ start:170 stop:298 length:129 start_codon:yes stop_codon:yes gene_type:complete
MIYRANLVAMENLIYIDHQIFAEALSNFDQSFRAIGVDVTLV